MKKIISSILIFSGIAAGLFMASPAAADYISFSVSNPVISAGQSTTVNIYSNTSNGMYFSSYYLSQNSNSSVVSASISGNTLTLFGLNYGSSNITVCQSGSSYACGTLYATVYGGNYNYGQISFSTSNPILNVGQSMAVSITPNSGFSNSFFISQNSNTNAVSASLSGTTLNLTGLNYGSSTIVIGQNNSSATGTLYVTVNGGSFNNGGNNYWGNLSFSTQNPNLTVGQSMAISIYSNYNNYGYGSNSYYISQNSNSSVVSASVSGNTLTLLGQNSGSSTITVCQNNNSVCGSLYVTVSGSWNSNWNQQWNQQNWNWNQPVVQYPSGQVLGAALYANGTLIKEGNTIYIVYRNTKSGFTNYSAFRGLGFSLANVQDVGASGLADSGHAIATQFAPHPWGTWIQYQGTVYFVDPSGLIPISDHGIFSSNGGNDFMVVPANNYDLAQPLLGLMTYNDSRLR